MYRPSNLPENWNYYYRICSTCGERYHRSGDEECRCMREAQEEEDPPKEDGEEEEA